MHLFELVDELEDYLSCDASNISDMIGFKTYSFRDLVLEYGPDHLSTVKVLWNAAQQKFNLIFGGKISTSLNQRFTVYTGVIFRCLA